MLTVMLGSEAQICVYHGNECGDAIETSKSNSDSTDCEPRLFRVYSFMFTSETPKHFLIKHNKNGKIIDEIIILLWTRV